MSSRLRRMKRATAAGGASAVEGIALAVSALVLALTPAAHAADCYAAGNRALDAGRTAAAVAAFGEAAARPECSASRPGLLHNQAVALHALADAAGDAALACRAAEAYRAVVALEPGSRVAQASSEALPAVERRCQTPDPPPPPPIEIEAPPAADHRLEWGLTAGAVAALGAGGALLALALDSADERDAADRRALAAAPGSAAEAAALDDFHEAGDRVDALGISGYALGGVGLTLAVAAVVAWVVDDGPAAVVQVGPRGLGLGGTW